MNNDWKPTEQNIGQPVSDNYIQPQGTLYIHNPKLSNWTCYLFGGSPGDGIAWTPYKGKVPNAWYRFWMKVFFDCTWVKNDT